MQHADVTHQKTMMLTVTANCRGNATAMPIATARLPFVKNK